MPCSITQISDMMYRDNSMSPIRYIIKMETYIGPDWHQLGEICVSILSKFWLIG